MLLVGEAHGVEDELAEVSRHGWPIVVLEGVEPVFAVSPISDT